MSEKLQKLLKEKEENYILPFFWQHGEDENTIRDYMKVIHESNIKAVCVESRPHPDFCGPGWWKTMDVILDEAQKRGMKVWILDDQHFPSGYANGAMEKQPDELCRQSLVCRKYDLCDTAYLHISKEKLLHPDAFVPNMGEERVMKENPPRKFEDDRLLGVFAYRVQEDGICRMEEGDVLNLTDHLKNKELTWKVPEGKWKVYVLHLSRNMGYHRDYINMMDERSVRVFLDAVYEPHWVHYKEMFGSVIVGFFSDEPELGNGHLCENGKLLGEFLDLPWSEPLEQKLKEKYGSDYAQLLPVLFENAVEDKKKAKIRYAYMDAVTKLVEKNFSMQIGTWCREHGVQYVGHIVEDSDQHARLGTSLGHYFRGLSGQDMAGIDDIGGQVYPGGENDTGNVGFMHSYRDGEFYHYMLAKLASSAAAIEPLKAGKSMCEIFGAYGWTEGLHLEKYLADHFMVRGVNHFTPHAFSAKAFPDPDCPPHFYAHGNNPEYRHFGRLMKYMNRVCELISDGYHEAPCAILYHGEGEWSGKVMPSHRPAQLLYDRQIDYDILPFDCFENPELYGTCVEKETIKVGKQRYRVLIVPAMQFVTKDFAKIIPELMENGVEVLFLEHYPEGIADTSMEKEVQGADEILMQNVKMAKSIPLSELLKHLEKEYGLGRMISPADDRIRNLHYIHKDGTEIWYFVNEGTKAYHGEAILPENDYARYDAWENTIRKVKNQKDGKGNSIVNIEVEPLKSVILVSGVEGKKIGLEEEIGQSYPVVLKPQWKRSICRSIEHPMFHDVTEICLPDRITKEHPTFSGFIRYENEFDAKKGKRYFLKITEAFEGVEVFLNGTSLGIQIVPEYLFELTDEIREGVNTISIEVATSLEREMAQYPNMFGQKWEAENKNGITGEVRLYEEE